MQHAWARYNSPVVLELAAVASDISTLWEIRTIAPDLQVLDDVVVPIRR